MTTAIGPLMAPPVPACRRAAAARVRAIAACGLVSAGVLGALAGLLNPIVAVVGVLVALLAVSQRRWPQTGAIVLLAAAVLIEQFPLDRGDWTDRLPFFRSLQSQGLTGVTVTILEIALALIVLFWLVLRARSGAALLPRSPLGASVAALLIMVVVGLVVGLMHGGDLRIALWEIRPWVYLATAYVVASSVLATRGAWRAVMWTIVIGSGIKAFQGLILFLQVRHLAYRPEALLGHEEAFFFGLFVALTLGLWVFGSRGRLRMTATALLPLVVFADMSNGRRTAWVIIGAEIAIILVLAYVRLPERRRTVRTIAGVVILFSAVYLPLFWNNSGTLGQPGRAVHTLVAPSPRDKASDQYRTVESYNLILNIRASGPLGKGFGIPIVNSAPIVNLTNIDSFIAFVPHNGILYLWMRMGLLGELAFWSVVAAGIITACKCFKLADRDAALIGMLVVCGIVAYLIIGYYDMGLYWFRIAVALGCLLGAAEGALRVRTPAASSDGAAETGEPGEQTFTAVPEAHREPVAVGAEP